MIIKEISPEVPGRVGRVCRAVGLGLLLTLSLGLSGCAWFHIGSKAGVDQPNSVITPAGAGASERQQFIENAGPAVRFVGAGALQLPDQP
jgi:hypothetical protein